MFPLICFSKEILLQEKDHPEIFEAKPLDQRREAKEELVE
jgi:hypothetical protein